MHLQGTLTGMHSRTQLCITNEKYLGPFRPVRPAGLDFQARPGPHRPAGRPALCHLYLEIIKLYDLFAQVTKTNQNFSNHETCSIPQGFIPHI